MITLNNTSNAFTGAVSINNTGGNNVVLTNNRALILGASSIGSGTLGLTASGSISQTGPLTQALAAGVITITENTAASDVLLNTQSNFLTGNITFAGTLSNYRDIGIRNTYGAATLPTNSLLLFNNLRNLTLQYDNAPLALSAVTL